MGCYRSLRVLGAIKVGSTGRKEWDRYNTVDGKLPNKWSNPRLRELDLGAITQYRQVIK